MNVSNERIISNTLANIYDWESEDLRTDFINFLHSEYKLDKEQLGFIFDNYNKLHPLIRDSIDFNLNDFVSKLLA